GGGDLLQIFRVLVAYFFLLRDGDRDVATVVDLMAERLEARFEPGDADSGRAHIDATARGAKVERHTDHTDLPRCERGDRGVIAPAIQLLLLLEVSSFRCVRHADGSRISVAEIPCGRGRPRPYIGLLRTTDRSCAACAGTGSSRER